MASTISRILSVLRFPIPVTLGGTGSSTSDGARAALGITGKNRIINGDVRVAQRGFNGVYTTGISGYGGPDRFLANNSSTGGQFTQSLGTLVDNGVTKNCVLQTVNTTVPDLSTNKIWSGITQIIEGVNCYDLLGSPITVSFLFRASVTGTYSVAIRDSTLSYSYVSTFSATANVVTKVVVTTPAIPLAASIPNTNGGGMSVWIGAINSATYSTSTLNAWQSGNFICGSASTLWGLTSGATIAVTELQLEAGTSATTFERKSYGEQLLNCKRYLQFITQDQSNYGTLAQMPFYYSVTLSVEMRTTPVSANTVVGSLTNVYSAVLTPLSPSIVSLGLINSAVGNASIGQRVYILAAEL